MIENPGDSRDAQDRAFLERVARPLRSPEVLNESFEERLMERIRAEAPVLYPGSSRERVASWWRTGRTARLSPITGFAVAAGLVGIIALASLTGDTGTAPPAAVAGPAAGNSIRSDTVHLVRFIFVDPLATTVEIVGDFNAWTRGVNRLEPSGAPGVWVASVAVPPGRHEYAFIVNGSRWIADPLAPTTSDEFGTESAVIRVGTTQQSAT